MFHTLFVVDDDDPTLSMPPLGAIRFQTYLNDYPKLYEPKMRVINLCDTAGYLSQGYYCSLLAEARHHEVLPSIKVINALRQNNSEGPFSERCPKGHASSKSGVNNDQGVWLRGTDLNVELDGDVEKQSQIVCMGEVENKRYKKLASKVFEQFPAPLLNMEFWLEGKSVRLRVSRSSLSELKPQQREFCLKVLFEYSRQSWRRQKSSKKYRWDLAMLVNPDEVVPPSNKAALCRFIKAGEKLGIRTQVVAASELLHLSQYDGLFIRETTAIDHHTYRLACQAERDGLVVMDDPDSILRCCNKVFLHDAFNYQKVPSLRTQFVSDASEATFAKLEETFPYPMVLKMPEGSFSKGVHKITNRKEFGNVLRELLAQSALVLAQEYVYTDFDWRVGVLNGRAIYACRYYMARNHWQIYNHESKRHFSGGFDTLPTFEVPKGVLDAALKASAVVGKGLYGIDIKEVEGRAFVIEVNDNPSIDHGVEDHFLGDELYMLIMSEFLRRFEKRGR